MKAVQGRCYLVTGGGSGLGAAVVEALVQRQARAVILDMNADQGTKLASSLNTNHQHDPVSLFVQTDVTSEGILFVSNSLTHLNLHSHLHQSL